MIIRNHHQKSWRYLVILGEAFFLAKCHTYKADNQSVARLVILGDTLFHTFYEGM